VEAEARAWEHSQGATAGTVDLLSRCRLFLSTDTGTSHLAAMMNVPQLAFRYVGALVTHDDFLPLMEQTNRCYFRRIPDEAAERPEEIVAAVVRALEELRVCHVYRPDPYNIGDLAALPAEYFPIPGAKYDVRLDDLTSIRSAISIVGGGGLISTYERELEKLGNKVVVWGAGSNYHGELTLRYPEWLSRCALVGVRDFGGPFRWAPCASCMSPLFDRLRAQKPKREAVVYRHFLKMLDGIPTDLNLPSLTNGEPSLENVLEFLASAEVVMTSSYHGAFWATLLGRKVIAVPFSSKFYGFRHPPVLANGEALRDWRSLAGQAAAYPEALEECREATLAFHRDVLALVE